MSAVTKTFAITDSSHAGEPRRFAQRLAMDKLGFDETIAGKLAIVASELVTNLLKHGKGGELILRTVHEGDTTGIELLALDRGPGMKNVAECMRDGYSTAGSPGTGLGAIQRLADLFELTSTPGLGTVVLARIWSKPLPRPKPGLEVGAISLPFKGETDCGDEWSTLNHDGKERFCLVDGLGHGRLAAEAAHQAIKAFSEHWNKSPLEVVRAAHLALLKTRGAALAVLELDAKEKVVRFSGVGNISAAVVNAEARGQNMVSHNGTAGAQLPRVQEFNYGWDKSSVLVMHSDGLSSRWQLGRYPGLLGRHPALIAGVLYRDFKRGNDDTTIVVARERR